MVAEMRKVLSFQMTIAEWIGTARPAGHLDISPSVWCGLHFTPNS